MEEKRKIQWKEVLTSILVGAFVAFFSSLFQGLADLVAGHGPSILGGATTTAALLTKRTLS